MYEHEIIEMKDEVIRRHRETIRDLQKQLEKAKFELQELREAQGQKLIDAARGR